MISAIKEQIIDGVINKIHIFQPEIYVDNEARGRSGHMGHAMIEIEKGRVLDFNANTSGARFNGHSAFGWMEYRISEDYGKSFGEAYKLPYSEKSFYDGIFTVSLEKAIVCDDGTVVAFCCRNSAFEEPCCMPWLTPTYLCSKDGGKNWTEAKEVSPYPGRIYDSKYYKGVIYALEFCNNDFLGSKPEHVYRLFKSENNGQTFEEVCVVPFPETQGRAYGAIIFNQRGELIVYAYNVNDEVNMDYIISVDCGKTWGKAGKSYVAEKIRNPQINMLDDQYILHGRSGEVGFVIYTSADGINWDKGHVLDRSKGSCYYSNNLLIKGEDNKNRLLIQYSEVYKSAQVNIMHMWLETL